jgi:ANTAR domain-containing protein/GAF domain-containing protein
MRDRDGWLNATMIEVADTGTRKFDEPTYVGGLALRLAELLGPAEVCLLLPGGQGTAPKGTASSGTASPGPRTGAAGTRSEAANPRAAADAAVAAGSGDLAAGLARLEAAGVPGPCTSCYRTGRAIRHLPLAEARTRWPEFTAAADAAGLAACSALPMRRQQETIGGVSVLTARGHVPRPADLRLAQALAELATIGILAQRELLQSQRLARQLQRALDSRVVIEQAKGAVSVWLGVTPADAFGLLRSYARARSLPLPQVAADVLDGVTPPDALVADGRKQGPAGAPRPAPVRSG